MQNTGAERRNRKFHPKSEKHLVYKHKKLRQLQKRLTLPDKANPTNHRAPLLRKTTHQEAVLLCGKSGDETG